MTIQNAFSYFQGKHVTDGPTLRLSQGKCRVGWVHYMYFETDSVMTGNEGVTRNQAGTYICEASNAHGLIQEKTKE